MTDEDLAELNDRASELALALVSDDLHLDLDHRLDALLAFESAVRACERAELAREAAVTPPRYVSAAIAAEAMGVSARHVRRWCADGSISGASRSRRGWQVPTAWLDEPAERLVALVAAADGCPSDGPQVRDDASKVG